MQKSAGNGYKNLSTYQIVILIRVFGRHPPEDSENPIVKPIKVSRKYTHEKNMFRGDKEQMGFLLMNYENICNLANSGYILP